MSKVSSKRFFIISFIPALAYWYLESKYSIRIAIMGGLGLAILELLFEKIFTHHVHALSKFNFFLILFLGLVSFAGDDGIWFKLQPAFTGVGIGGYLLFRRIRGRSLLYEMAASFNENPPPQFLLGKMERDSSIFMICYGLFMAFVAFQWSSDRWVFFKTAGFYLAFGVFMAFEVILSRFRIKKEAKRVAREKILSNFRY